MLYIVATPIGNLGDITLRALEALKSADLIAAEDTRHSGMLLKHFKIDKPFISYHEHNEAMRTAQLVERLAAGENIALITDAGMPGLSDPGARLIRECVKRELPLTIIPGRVVDPDRARRFGIFDGEIYFSWILATQKRRTRTRFASRQRARRNDDLFRIASPVG